MLLYQILAYAKHEKTESSQTKTRNVKYLGQRGMEILNYLMDQFCIIYSRLFRVLSPKGWYLQLLTSEIMKLLGNTKSKITQDENDENVPHLEITEVVLVHCNIVNNDYEHDLRVVYTFVPNGSFGQLLNIPPKNFIFFYIFFMFYVLSKEIEDFYFSYYINCNI